MSERTAAHSLYLFIALFLGIGACVISLGFFAFYTLDAARAYVAGEGHYSKGQKDAVAHLYRYAATQDDAEYLQFEQALVPALGDRQARLALQQVPPDLTAARQGFLAGKNHPEDIDKMIWMFQTLGEVSEMKASIEIWGLADEQVQILRKLGEAFRTATQSGASEEEYVQRLIEIERVDQKFSMLVDRYSQTLGEGARVVTATSRLLTIVSTLILIVIGVGISRQIVQRIHRTELRLLASEARFRHVVESNIIGIAFWRNDGGIVDANQAFLDLVGYAKSDLPNLDWRNITASEHWTFDESAGDELDSQGFSRPYEKDFIHQDGHRVPVLLGSATNPGDKDGGLSFVLGIAEQRALEAALVRTQKLEAVGTLVGGIAHHFNNALAGIYGNIEIARVLNRDPLVEKNLSSIQDLAERNANTIQKLMAFARRDFLTFHPVSLPSLVEELIPAAVQQLGINGEVSQDISAEPLIVLGDEKQLKNILLSLISNASEAVHNVASPLLQVTLRKLPSLSDAGLTMAELSITDNGVGMSPEVQKHLFEPFFTTRKVGEGTGLSLSMAYGTINAHNGEIEVLSESGKGTTVIIRLPLHVPEAA